MVKSGSIETSAGDKAFEDWGSNAFQESLGLVPQQALTPGFVKDRETIFPILKREDLKTLRPSALAGFQSRLRQVETVFLAKGGPFINGEKLSVADVHVIFGLRWALNDLGVAQDAGSGKDAFPKLWKLIESLPAAKPEVLSSEDMLKQIRESGYSADGPTSVMKNDPYGLEVGAKVTIESFE